MVGSIDPRCETVRGTHWPKKIAWLFGARVAETILASDPLRPHQQAGHMDASDPIRPEKLLRHGGRPHMGPGSRSLRSLVRDDTDRVIARRFPIRFSNSQGRHCEEPTGRANARPMTGSATKQSIVTVRPMDCFASLAMTLRGQVFQQHHRRGVASSAPRLVTETAR